MAKSPIKIPKLYRTETIEIEGNKIEISGYKPADKEYEIAIRHIRKEVADLQKETNEITLKEDGSLKDDSEVSEEELNRVQEIYQKIIEIQDAMIYGDPDRENKDRMEGPIGKLAQRGLKRFYYPNKTSSELDEINDIDIGEEYITMISSIMIALSKPPSGLEQSIQARKEEDKKNGSDKGKLKGGKISQPRKKPKTSEN